MGPLLSCWSSEIRRPGLAAEVGGSLVGLRQVQVAGSDLNYRTSGLEDVGCGKHMH